jgi:hypothetical protein
LFEAFRDSLIEVENQGFPIAGSPEASEPPTNRQFSELARTIDRNFAHHYALDPLKVVVVGEKTMRAAFGSVTVHGPAVIGQVDGDHTLTSGRDLGQIVWPLVKEAMSRVVDDALQDLEAHAARGRVASGLEAVARQVARGVQATLLVEEDYHLRGGFGGTTGSPVIYPEVDVRDSIDDAIDAVIEKVLQAGGTVLFTPSGLLTERHRIASFLRDDGGSA